MMTLHTIVLSLLILFPVLLLAVGIFGSVPRED
jgi:hypothetical protein